MPRPFYTHAHTHTHTHTHTEVGCAAAEALQCMDRGRGWLLTAAYLTAPLPALDMAHFNSAFVSLSPEPFKMASKSPAATEPVPSLS